MKLQLDDLTVRSRSSMKPYPNRMHNPSAKQTTAQTNTIHVNTESHRGTPEVDVSLMCGGREGTYWVGVVHYPMVARHIRNQRVPVLNCNSTWSRPIVLPALTSGGVRRSREIPGRVDEADVREGLRKVPDQSASPGVVLLAQEPHIVAETE